MFRKNYFTFLLSIALFLVGGVAVFGQAYPVIGKVVVKKADGTLAPVEGALVQVYRIETKAKLPKTTTDKKGVFTFAGLQPAKYVLAISGPGISPLVYPGVPAGETNVSITVSEGDGKQFTEDEVRQILAKKTSTTSTDTTAPVEMTADQKKAQEEELKKRAATEAKNKNIENKNALRQAAFTEGNAAIGAKNYDLAIAKFEEGYQVDTVYLGSAPVFMTGKARVYSLRAVDKFNKSGKLADATAKIAAMNDVKKDFADSIDAFNLSWTMLKNAPPASIPDPKNYETNKSEVLNGMQDTIGYMIGSEQIEATKLDIIKDLTLEYINAEPDAAKKLKAQINLADVYRIVGDSDNAIIEYKKALVMSPDNPDATAGLGLSLFNAGVMNNNVAQQQEGFGYMERFSQIAPDNHKLKASVADAVTYLKSQKITPQKVTTTKKKN